MKTVNHIKLNFQLFQLIIPAMLLFFWREDGSCPSVSRLPGDGSFGPTNSPLDSWSFQDNTNWTSDFGYAPVSFTNLNFSHLGNGASLVVDTNIPAWLQYNVYEDDGTTNLTVDVGSVTFWFAADWSSTNDANGGLGPQEWGRLLEVGGYTPDSSYGWWSIYVDDAGANLYFSAQTNDGSGNTYTLSAPIDWTTNYFHFVALTYSSTNVSLYLDGQLATNDPGGLSVWPGNDVLANGFYIGSDSNGVLQAHGLFNTVATYNYPLASNDVQTIFNWDYTYYEISPWNTAMDNIVSAPTSASTNGRGTGRNHRAGLSATGWFGDGHHQFKCLDYECRGHGNRERHEQYGPDLYHSGRQRTASVRCFCQFSAVVWHQWHPLGLDGTGISR